MQRIQRPGDAIAHLRLGILQPPLPRLEALQLLFQGIALAFDGGQPLPQAAVGRGTRLFATAEPCRAQGARQRERTCSSPWLRGVGPSP